MSTILLWNFMTNDQVNDCEITKEEDGLLEMR